MFSFARTEVRVVVLLW